MPSDVELSPPLLEITDLEVSFRDRDGLHAPFGLRFLNRVDEEPHPLRGQPDRLVTDPAALRPELCAYRHVETTAGIDLVLHVPQEHLDQQRAARTPSLRTIAGSITSSWNSPCAVSIVASCSSSFEPKWAKSPLLLIPTASARRPIESPLIPSTVASCAASCRIALRLARRRFVACGGPVPRPSLDKIARPFVYSPHERSCYLLQGG